MRTMNSVRRPDRIAAAIALGLAIASSPAFATPKIGPKLEYEDFVSKLCNTRGCEASFAPVPLGKTLIIGGLSCRIQTVQPIFDAYLTSPGTDRKVYLTTALSTTISDRYVYMINMDAGHVVTTLTAPKIKVTTLPPKGQVVEISCNISGQLE